MMDRTMAGKHMFPGETPRIKLGYAESGDLTDNEIGVLRLICEGFENKELAEELSVSAGAVKNHIANILYKT